MIYNNNLSRYEVEANALESFKWWLIITIDSKDCWWKAHSQELIYVARLASYSFLIPLNFLVYCYCTISSHTLLFPILYLFTPGYTCSSILPHLTPKLIHTLSPSLNLLLMLPTPFPPSLSFHLMLSTPFLHLTLQLMTPRLSPLTLYETFLTPFHPLQLTPNIIHSFSLSITLHLECYPCFYSASSCT